MRIKKLALKNYGPFPRYEILFPDDEQLYLLLVGKNNEGKSTILRALKLINDATKVLGKTKNRITIDGDVYYSLLKQDVEDIRIGRLIFNYNDDIGQINAVFNDNFEIVVYLDTIKDIIYAENFGGIPDDIDLLFGIIPPLGPIAENEEIISKMSYLKANINTSLAPRHLRNYLFQILTPEQFELVKYIVKSTWKNIELLICERNFEENRLESFYKENGVLREISWAGQGLQIWFQIITHIVLLMDSKVLLLDEPEVNLHPEKQNELISIIKQIYNGSVIIATHSIELMNNVNISHIIHVRKDLLCTKVKTTNDRLYLEEIRANIGSNFNFIASQFEEVDYLIFTEGVDDYKIIKGLLEASGKAINDFNIPINGFQQYSSAIYFKESYFKFIGKNPQSIIFLDKDYYPEEYFETIRYKLNQNNITLVLTPGKEIENIFIFPELYKTLLTEEQYKIFKKWFHEMLTQFRDEAFGDYTGIFLKVTKKGREKNTTIKESIKSFNTTWETKIQRYNIVPGKKVLKEIRNYFQKNNSITLTHNKLINLLAKYSDKSKIDFIVKVIKE